jgi:hypothetical protein
VDGSLVGLFPGLPGKWGFVRQRVGTDKSFWGGTQEPFAKSLIFTPAGQRWSKWRGHLPPSEVFAAASYQASIDI